MIQKINEKILKLSISSKGLVHVGEEGGVGSYPGFTHYDVRDSKARW
jgi:hypothetical protein